MNSRLRRLIEKEVGRQKKTINLIASENFASPAILKILGSPLTNKYSEGYPGRRYYPACRHYDEIEKLAQKLALRVFGLASGVWSVNVQPYSGTPANLEIYAALMKPGDVLMGMGLAAGGHLSHGSRASFSGRLYRAVFYGAGAGGFLDYGEIEKLAKKHRPKVIVSGASAYPRKIDFQKFGRIAKKVGAYHLADISHIAGLVAAGAHPSPFPWADVVMTTTHKTLRGPRGAAIFSKLNVKRQGSDVSIAEAIDKAVFPGFQGGPHQNVVAAMAQTFSEALRPNFKKYQLQIVKNAEALAAALATFGFDLVSGGTDNHLLLIDLRRLEIDGFWAEKKLEQAGLAANRNLLAGDASPFRPSGLRLGTPAVASRGMKEKEMRKIAEWIYRLLIKKENPVSLKKEVEKTAKKFPLPYRG